MNTLFELLKIIIPSLIVLATALVMIKTFLSREKEKEKNEIKTLNQKVILPLRLQAYERVCLFLERISPNVLLHRVNNSTYHAVELQRALLQDIRFEFEHNLSQQVYLSPEAWNLVSQAKEEITKIIILSAQGLNSNHSNMDLIKAITDRVIKMKEVPTLIALNYIKKEVAEYF
ncbi:MAG: hypothetical protein A3H98_00205 [Bacteroidetes bacterium RIFCSPLOWO2_02_FULL_36_8]|nr:MAG: hypothetical protein A3H98_00205 [Bacteroidetes bacterium RIFCSPLOWO2_02_FULL_36_8]OFY70844.1 MAG: hypothetical protein A3G23_12030 [Bacteroidetes bacterium RIFCSPLOWO2_12_FULL_37_12]